MATVTAPPQEPKAGSKTEGAQLISKGVRTRPLFDPEIMNRAIKQSFVKLNPRVLAKNPVMFVVEVGAALTTLFVIKDIVTGAGGLLFGIQIALWLWFTVLFANFAEAMAEARGKAQADNLRKTKTDTMAKKLLANGKFDMVPSSQLRAGDTVFVEAGYLIPGDGEVVEGIASVDESVITGESAPVIRESGGDRSAVTGGTKVLSDHITIKITSNPGETFLDRMIALVEGAARQKTPNEIALNILIAGLTLDFPAGCLHVATLFQVRHPGGRQRHGAFGGSPGFAPCLSDSNDHRRTAVGNRYRRHGSSDATQRPCNERKGSRSVRRREYVAPGQDWNDHPR